ncbi:MAG: helix-turn-helix transcriptional regulator [Candidatus Limiplasma sp.]|nr:helix-turn-helix transcriptional regulator [Candidatus Limiplasma sp.]
MIELIDPVLLGKRVTTARNEKGLSREELAEIINITPSYVRLIETGKRYPSGPVVCSLCNALSVSPLYLLQDSLTIPQPDPYDRIVKLLLSVTPGQAEIVVNLIEAVIPSLKEE